MGTTLPGAAGSCSVECANRLTVQQGPRWTVSARDPRHRCQGDRLDQVRLAQANQAGSAQANSGRPRAREQTLMTVHYVLRCVAEM